MGTTRRRQERRERGTDRAQKPRVSPEGPPEPLTHGRTALLSSRSPTPSDPTLANRYPERTVHHATLATRRDHPTKGFIMQLRTIAVTALTVATLIAPTSATFAQDNPTPTTTATPTTTSAPTAPLTAAQITEIRREAMEIRTAAKNQARVILDAKIAAAAKTQKAALKTAASIKSKDKRLSRIADIRMTYYKATSIARDQYFDAVLQARAAYEAAVENAVLNP